MQSLNKNFTPGKQVLCQKIAKVLPLFLKSVGFQKITWYLSPFLRTKRTLIKKYTYIIYLITNENTVAIVFLRSSIRNRLALSQRSLYILEESLLSQMKDKVLQVHSPKNLLAGRGHKTRVH